MGILSNTRSEPPTATPWPDATRASGGHDHVFLGANHDRNARKTWTVVGVSVGMMVLEIAGGLAFNSMALLADGVHMATHAGTLLVAALAYRYARRRLHDPRFSFGTGKVGDLVAFASAIALAATSLFIAVESVGRLLDPRTIAFDQALPVAVLGLLVNIVSAWLLHDSHDHGHGPDHAAAPEDHDEHHHDHGHHHHDFNLKAAYAHVAADALVSVLAIVALILGRQFGWLWLDPVMGFVGAFVILKWSVALMKSTGAVLLDMAPAGGLEATIRRRLEVDGDRVVDLHVWRLGPGHRAAIVAVATPEPKPTQHYRDRLQGLDGLSHLTIEVNAATSPSANPAAKRMDMAAKPPQGGPVTTPALAG